MPSLIRLRKPTLVHEEAAMRCFFAAALSAFLLSIPALAQMGQTTTGREIDGFIRSDAGPPPPGVTVFLDYAPSHDGPPPTASGELGRAMTDSSGRFHFHLAQAPSAGSTGLYAISAHCQGFKDTFQVVDLTLSPHITVTLELHRDTSKDMPSVPPGGPGDTLVVHRASSEVQAALKKGQQLLLEKHDPKGSIESFKKALKHDPANVPGYLLLGAAYVQTQQWADAQAAFEKAVKLEPNNPQALLGLGVALDGMQDFNGAQKPLQQSVQLAPNSAEAHYELGRSLWGLGKWQEAEPHATRAIAINKDFPPTHVLMGNIYLRRRDAGAALREFHEYLRLDPQGPFVEPVKGMVEKINKATGQH
jgi:Flp pilus assembly protein TadD